MEFKGKVTRVMPLERGMSQRGPWVKQTVIIEYESGQYPKTIAISNQKNAEDFGKLREGDVGTFKVDFKAHEYNNKAFNDVTCWGWKIDEPQGGYQQGPI